MPLPSIVVDIAPPESAPALKQAMLEACTRAAQDARCVDAPEEGALVRARVVWNGAAGVRIEIALPNEQRTVERDLEFDERDAEIERWRAAGLVVGTLASVLRRGEKPLPASEAPEPGDAPAGPAQAATLPATAAPGTSRPSRHGPRAKSNPAAPRPARSRSSGSVQGAGLLGSSLSTGPLRIGGELGGRIRLSGEWLFASVGVGYSGGANPVGGVATRWSEAVAGFALAERLGGPFVGVARVEGLCQRLEVSTDRATSGAKSGQRWLGGVRLGAGVDAWIAEPFGVFVDASGQWTAGTTEVRLAGTSVGAARPLGLVWRGGLTYRLP